MKAKEIQSYVTSQIFGKKIFAYEVVESTNTTAKSLIQDSTDGTIVIADAQTAGRGRLKREWLSEPKKNLTFSVIIKPEIAPELFGVLSLYAGLSVAEAIESVAKLRPVCKWPNDVMLNGKKFCGILSEAVFNREMLAGVIVGIGININQSIFPRELESIATSLLQVTGKELDRFSILAAVLDRMEYNYTSIKTGNSTGIIEGWKKYSTMFGKEITINQDKHPVRGIAKRLDDDGGLILLTNKGEEKFLAGDVALCS